MLRSVTRRQYRIARYDGYGDVIEGAQYTVVSEETPTPDVDTPESFSAVKAEIERA